MERLPTISADTLIEASPAGVTTGVLGPIFVRERSGYLFSLTAAPAVCGATKVAVTSQSGDREVISNGPPRMSRNSEPSLNSEHLLALVPLENRVLINCGPVPDPLRRTRPSLAPALSSLLGSEVDIHTSRGPRRGVLISADSHFRMPRPWDGIPTVFDRVLEIRSMSNAPLVAKGDAGSLVATPDGAYLGVLVGADGNNAFAAPIADTLRREGLRIPTANDIRTQNDRLMDPQESLFEGLAPWTAGSDIDPVAELERAGHGEIAVTVQIANAAADQLLGPEPQAHDLERSL